MEDKPSTAMTGVVESELEGVVTEGNLTATQDEAMTEGALDVDAIEGTSVKVVLEGATNKEESDTTVEGEVIEDKPDTVAEHNRLSASSGEDSGSQLDSVTSPVLTSQGVHGVM